MATYPMPTAGQYNMPAFQAFLSDHPKLASLGSPAEQAKFLDAHPHIAARYMDLIGPKPAAPAATAAPATPAATSAPAAPAPGSAPGAASAKAIITSTLDSYGLGALGDWAWGQYLNGVPTEQIMVDLRKRPEYTARFPAMAALSAKGQAIDEATYIAAEKGYAAQAHAAGLPEGFYNDPTDFAKLIEGNVSAQEWGDRLQMAQQTAIASPQGQQLRDELSRLYGLPNAVGLVTAYWIDPDKSAAIIKQQFTAAQIASESAMTGFGSLTKAQAEKIGGTGVSADQAGQAFTGLAGLHELQTSLVGDSGSQAVDQNTMIDATFTGDAAAQKKLKNEQARRVGQFQGGGGFATGQGGVSGLGSANR